MLDPSQLPQQSPFNYPAPQIGGTGGLFGRRQQLPGQQFPALPSGGLFGSPGMVPPPNFPGTNPTAIPPALPPGLPTPPNQPADLPADNGGDFLQDVRKVGADILGGALSVLDFPAKVIARPAFELITEPQVFVQKVDEGQGDIWKTINLLSESFQANQAPGVVKFLGEAALDPLTYLSAGTAKAVTSAKYIKPLVDAIPGGAQAAAGLIGGLEHYEKAVDSAFSSGSDLVRGIATNYIPLGVAKENARTILTKTLPEGLVSNILDSIPNEYTGIPIGPISRAVNKAVPNLGLPTVLAAPDVRVLKNASAYNSTWDAAKNAFSNRGINIFDPVIEGVDYGQVLRDVVRNPQDQNDLLAASIIRRPQVQTATDINRLSSEIGGTLKRDITTTDHVLQYNSLLNDYHLGNIDEGTTVQALSQMFGVSPKTNPDAMDSLSRLLRGRDLATTSFINDLSKLPPQQAVEAIAARAKGISNKEFDVKIANERQANTYMDQFLNGFDNVYTNIYKNTVLRFVIQPVSMLYLGFVGYPVGNAVESYARHIIGGGGVDLPVSTQHFNLENGLLDLPRELFNEQTRQAYVTAEIVARGKGTALDYPVGLVSPMIRFGSELEQGIRRHYVNNVLAQELDNVYFAKGLGARTDFHDWIAASAPIQVGNNPQFAGLPQQLSDSVSRMAVKAVSAGPDAVEAVKNSIDTGLFNRKKLAADLLDNEDFANLHPTSRAIMSQWAETGERSAAGANGMIDKVVENEKKLLEIAPAVLAEKFKGLSDKIVARSASPTFAGPDLFQSLNDLRALREQYAGIPELLRRREYEILQANQLKGMDVAAIHDKFAQDLKTSMDAINKAVSPSYQLLVGQADRLGLRGQVEPYINALRAQQDLLAQTWNVDAEFRANFFAGKPNRKLQSTWDDPVEGYFPQRRDIWDRFQGQHQVLSQEAETARLNLEVAIKDQRTRQAIFNDAIAQMEAHKANAGIVEEGLNAGQSAEEIAAAVDNSGFAPESISGQQPAVEAGGGINVNETIRPGENGANDITGNGPSADSAANIPSSTILTDQYAATDSIRPRIEARLQQAFNTPAMTEQQKTLLTQYVDNLHNTYNSLDQSGRKILNDSLKEAVTRTVDRYHKAYINYDDQNIFDFLAKHIFPFWVYESRRWPYLAHTAVKFPGLAAAYNNYMDKTDNGYVNIGETPFDINPLRGTVLGGINRAVGRDMPLRQTTGLQGALESIEATLGKFGFYMGPHISIPSQIIRGEAGQALPELFSSAINLGRAADVPGAAGFEELLPDPFRDYYVRQILASQNLEPDKVYQAAADDPNSIEAKALDTAQRQAGIVGIVLGQTGVLRFRTPEYQQFLEKKMQSVESITGISVQKQQEMRQQGISLSQVSTLTPAQRQELAALPGTTGFQEVSEPLLNPVAQKLRQQQREFFDAVKAERVRVLSDQGKDDDRLAGGIISGAEWRKRYQGRSGDVSTMVQDLKKTEAYKNVPVTSDEQAAARQRFNLPALTQSPVDIVLQEYYNVKPETDAITDDVNWSKFFSDRQAVLSKYPAVYQAVRDQIEKNDTPQVRDFKAAMELLRPYFGIKDQVLQQYPQFAQETSSLQYLQNTNPVEAALYRQASPTIKILNKIVSNYQDAARVQFPQIDAALVKYYGSTPMSVQMMGKTQGGLTGSGGSIRLAKLR